MNDNTSKEKMKLRKERKEIGKALIKPKKKNVQKKKKKVSI